MTVTIDEIDAMPAGEAAALFLSCCGSTQWVDAMVSRRPFRSSTNLLSAAVEAWSKCGARDWLEAFAHHPRIGGSRSATPQSDHAKAWSAGEQSGVRSASATAQDKLAEINRDYEARFGHIYIVCATGKSAEEMISIAGQRLGNDPATELRIAAEEQWKITQIRLRKLLGADT